MKAKFSYSLTFIVGGKVKDYTEILSWCGMCVENLTRENVYDYRSLCELVLKGQGITDYESELICSC